MRLFEERVGISSSYIHGIEKENLLPSSEKLDLLASVFVAVAGEQNAAEPQDDARSLFRERERTAFVDRLGFDPELAEVLVLLRELEANQRADIIQPLTDAIILFKTLDPQERGGVKKLIHNLRSILESLEGEARRAAALHLDEVAEKALEDVSGADGAESAMAPPPQPA